MPTYASGVYNNENALGKIYAGENQVQRVFECKETAFVPEKEPLFADILIVAGGGGGNGGLCRGGSGAGGMRTGTKKFYADTNYTLTVGAGGAHSTITPTGGTNAGSVGGDSSLERRSHGGGVEGTDGGSGAGSDGIIGTAHSDALAVDCGDTDIQGKDGAAGSSNQGGGGGGHNAAGSTPNGGAGSVSSITGSSVTYAGGGGGGGLFASGGSGGAGGGGAGGDGTYTGTTYSSASPPPQSIMGEHGAANTGGGGGGGGYYQWDSGLGYNTNEGGEGGNGGSGFVCIKFPDTFFIIVDSGLTHTSATSGGYTTAQFTAGTGDIMFTDDEHFGSVTFLFEDTNTDLSNSNISMTFGSDTSLDSFAKVGTHSMKFTPSSTSANNRVTLATDSDLDMGTGDFTFECWFYLNNVTQDTWARLISNPNGDANTSIIYKSNDKMYIYNGGSGNPNADFQGTTTITKGQWNHLALTRSGNTMTLWINGSSDATHTAGASEDYSFSGAAFGDDINNTLTDNEWNGYIDQVRITKGVARYSSTFDPLTGDLLFPISLVSDGSSYWQPYALIQLEPLPTGATGYRFDMTGTAYNGAFTGVVLAILSPSNGTTYRVNTQAGIANNPSDNGPQNKNMRAVFITASNQVKIYANNDNGADDVTVIATAINDSYEAVTRESNQLTGIEIDEDG